MGEHEARFSSSSTGGGCISIKKSVEMFDEELNLCGSGWDTRVLRLCKVLWFWKGSNPFFVSGEILYLCRYVSGRVAHRK